MRGKAITVSLIAGIAIVGLYHGARSAIESWSTSAGSNNSTPPDGFPENMNPSDVNNAAREVMAQVRRYAAQAVLSHFAPDGGSANTYFITPAIPPAAYISGQRFHFVAANANTGAATLRIGSLAATSLVKISNQALASGDIVASGMYTAVYDGTNFQLLNPKLGSLANLSEVGSSQITDYAITWAKIAQATQGVIMTWGSNSIATHVTPGLSQQVLMSAGPNAVPRFQTITTAAISAGASIRLDTVVNNGMHITAHNLGAVPNYLEIIYRNNVAECNYGPGEMAIGTADKTDNTSNGINIIKTATAVKLIIGDNFTYLINPVDGVPCALTPGNWGIQITPYKFNLN